MKVSHTAVKSFDRRGVSCKNARTVQFSGGVGVSICLVQREHENENIFWQHLLLLLCVGWPKTWGHCYINQLGLVKDVNNLTKLTRFLDHSVYVNTPCICYAAVWEERRWEQWVCQCSLLANCEYIFHSVCLSVSLSVCLSCLSCLSVCLSVSVSVSVCVCLSVGTMLVSCCSLDKKRFRGWRCLCPPLSIVLISVCLSPSLLVRLSYTVIVKFSFIKCQACLSSQKYNMTCHSRAYTVSYWHILTSTVLRATATAGSSLTDWLDWQSVQLDAVVVVVARAQTWSLQPTVRESSRWVDERSLNMSCYH